MKKRYLTTILFLLFSITGFSQNGAPTCDAAEPMCSDNNGVKIFPNVTGVTNQGVFGCLQDSPNPAWFYIKVDQTGDLEFNIVQNTMFDANGNPTGAGIDVDFIAWGPFRTSDGNCNTLSPDCGTQTCINNTDDPNFYFTNQDGTNIIDCSWSGQAEERFRIPNAQTGDFYVLLVTNWTATQPGTPGFIKLEQTNFGQTGAGVTDCTIIAGDLGPDQTVCEGTQIDLDGEPANPTTPIASYQWQLSTDGGITFSDIVGETNSTYSITNDISGTYRIVVTDSGGISATDDVIITFVPPPTVDAIVNPEQCVNDTFTIEATNITNADTFIWQESQDNGASWNDLSNDATYSNVDTTTLTITNVPDTSDNFQYRLSMSNSATANDCINTTNEVTLTVNPLPTANAIANLNQCENDTFTIQATNVMNADTFVWQVSTDGGTTFTNINSAVDTFYSDENTDTLTITNAPTTINNNQYQVVLSNSSTSCLANSNAATLTIHSLPTANTIADINRCENDTFTIDAVTTNAATFTWQVSDDGGTTWNDVTANANYSTETTASLTITNVPNSFNNYQYRVGMSNTNAMNCDSFSNATTLTVNPLPTATTIADLNQCENDTFTITANTTNADVIEWQVSEDGGATWNMVMAGVNYAGVTTNTLQISNVPFSFNNFQYRVNMSNAAVANCNNLSNATTLTVNELPTANTIADITQCEADTFTINAVTTNASTFQWQVSDDGGATFTDVIADANYSNETTTSLTITNVPNSFNNNQYRVSMSNTNAMNCDSNSNAMILTINPLPVLVSYTLAQCDDDVDGISVFNLTEANAEISTNSANETFAYFTDAAYTTPVADDTAYQNTTPTNDVVYVRVTNTTTLCSRDIPVNLLVTTTQIPATFNRTFNVCDDFADINGDDSILANNDDTDGISSFNFESVRTEIEALFPVQNVTVTFYRNLGEAQREENEITDAINYRNIGYANMQDIYVRVDNDLDNGCLGLGAYINLIVDPVPTANPINATNTYEECDDFMDGDGANGVIQSWNLESLTPTILGGQSATSYTVTYHEFPLDTDPLVNPNLPLASPYTNTSPNTQTIYVRVAGNGCSYDRYTFDLIVNSLPIANPLNMTNTHEVCDNDSDGSATNGFVQNIDLDALTPTILGAQDPANYTVTYHTAPSRDNATLITGLYTNATANGNVVYVRIEENTGCINDRHEIIIQVNPEPLGNPDNTLLTLSECDTDADGDDANGFVTFDLNSQIPDILGDPAMQDEDDFNVTFHLTQTDATLGDNPQSSPFTNTIINGQTIFVRIENKTTSCVNDDVNFEVIVNPLPDFVVTTPQPICLNNPPLTLVAENPNDVYTYQWFDSNGSNIGNDISLDVTVGGEYTVTATTTNSNNMNCSRSRTITVTESNIAVNFEIGDVTIDDAIYIDGSNTNSITINNSNLGQGDYEFALLNEAGITIRNYQDEPVFEGLEGGIYTINVRDKNRCGVVSLPVAVIEFPKFFTPNGDGFNDTWTIKGGSTSFFPTNLVQVFNRQGKVITQFSFNTPGWNGLYKENQMPSDDYWFKIILTDREGNKFTKKGHFSLLRK